MLYNLQVKNIKGIVDFNENISQVNQITGGNGVGKTSINESIRFLINGSLKNKNLIKEGEEQAFVYGAFSINGDKVEIHRQIDHDECVLSVTINGVSEDTTTARNMVEKLCGIASFDPRDVLNPKKRNKIFESFVTIPFEMSAHITRFKDANSYLPKDLELNRPIECLTRIRDGLDQYRLNVGREKKSAKAVVDDAVEMVKTQEKKLEQTGFLNVNIIRPVEVLLTEKVKYQVSIDNRESVKNEIKKTESSIYVGELQRKDYRKQIEGLYRQVSYLETLEGRSIERDKNLKKEKEKLNVSLPVEVKGVDLEKELNASRMLGEIQTRKMYAQDKNKMFKEKEKEYYEINRFLKEDYDFLYSPYLSEMEKRVSGFSFAGGEYRYNGNRIADLSSGESLQLAIKIIESQDLKSNIVCIDNAECLDDDNIRELNLNKVGTNYIVLKVGQPFPIQSSNIHLTKGVPNGINHINART